MSDPNAANRATAGTVLRALRRTRQVRQFTPEPVTEADLQALLEVARWSGSSINRQPWTFIVIRDRAELVRLAELAPHAKHIAGAAVAIAVAMSGENPEWDAYDEGRVAERILVAAGALGLGAAIGWAVAAYRPGVSGVSWVDRPGVRSDDHLPWSPDRRRTTAAFGRGDRSSAARGARPGALKQVLLHSAVTMSR